MALTTSGVTGNGGGQRIGGGSQNVPYTRDAAGRPTQRPSQNVPYTRDAMGRPTQNPTPDYQRQYQTALGMVMGDPRNSSQIAGLGMVAPHLQAQAGYAQQGRDIQRGSLQSDYDIGMRSLGLDEQGIGLDRQSNNLGYQSNNLDRELIGKQRGFAGTERDLTQFDALRNAYMQTLGNNSNAIAGGAMHAPMVGIRNANFAADAKSTSDRAQLGYDQTIAGLDNRMGKLALDDQQIGIANQQLDLKAAQIGINRDQLRQRLNEGIAKLGLEGQIDADNLMYQLGQNINNQNGLLGQLYADAINMVASDPTNGMMGSMLQQFGYPG